MDQLPLEILAECVSFLSLRARLVVVSFVSRRFNQAVKLSISPSLPRVPSVLPQSVLNSVPYNPLVDRLQQGITPDEWDYLLDIDQHQPTTLQLGSLLTSSRVFRRTPAVAALTSLTDLTIPLPSPLQGWNELIHQNAASLTRLSLAAWRLGNEDTFTFAKMPLLRSLSITLTPRRPQSELHLFKKLLVDHCTQLEELAVHWSPFEDFFLLFGEILSLPRLQSLVIKQLPFRYTTPSPDTVKSFLSLISRAPRLTRLVLHVNSSFGLLEILPAISKSLIELGIFSITKEDTARTPQLINALQACEKLTRLFPPFPDRLDAASEHQLHNHWTPLILALGHRLEHLIVPWGLRANSLWPRVWQTCTSLTSLHFTAFGFWYQDADLPVELHEPLTRIESLVLQASDFDIMKSHHLCHLITKRAPRLRHLVFYFDQVNTLEYVSALSLLRVLWRKLPKRCPHLQLLVWKSHSSDNEEDHSTEALRERIQLQKQNPFIELQM